VFGARGTYGSGGVLEAEGGAGLLCVCEKAGSKNERGESGRGEKTKLVRP